MITGPQAIARAIDELGQARKPFCFVINFDATEALLLPLAQLGPAQVLYHTPRYANWHGLAPQAAALGHFHRLPPTLAQYRAAFGQVMHHLQRGDTFLCNLTLPTQVHFGPSLRDVFLMSEAKYKLLIEGLLVCFSPESFVQIDAHGRIASFPMKGTIDAALPHAEERILADKKEHAEHATIVDLIRNDLSMVAERVRVERFRYVERVRTHTGRQLLQVSSEVCGQLAPHWHAQLGSILCALLPAGSISGAPKPKTVDIIRAAEPCPRGWYTGIFGIYDGHRLDSAVMIRFIEQRPDGSRWFRSGGGITHLSQAQSEYDELVAKVYVPLASLFC